METTLYQLPAAGPWDCDEFGNRYALATTGEQLAAAASLEQSVWHERGFGDLVELGYEQYIDASRTLTVTSADDAQCIAVNRLFHLSESVRSLPFMMFPVQNHHIAQLGEVVARKQIEEIGTVAVLASRRSQNTAFRLWRLAYRDALDRGIQYFGAIMEPPRMRALSRAFGLPFTQLGPSTWYQGGDCAPFVLNLREGRVAMKRNLPLLYEWFFENALMTKNQPQFRG